MASSGGHWLNLAEAQLLTQTHLVPGVVDDDIRRGGLLGTIPLAQAAGQSIDMLRTAVVRTAKTAAVGDTLTWEEAEDYDKVTVSLQKVYDQSRLDKFVESVYGTINNYEAIQVLELQRSVVKKTEDLIIYGDNTYGTNEPDGLHAWAETQAGNLDQDGGETNFSVITLRALLDDMKYGVSVIMMGFVLGRRLDAFLQEAGQAVSNGFVNGIFTFPGASFGMPVTFFQGHPIVRSDYMVAEQANTGVGSDARAKNTSGTKQYSIFAVKFGQVMQGEPGLALGFGGREHSVGEIFRLVYFKDLPDYDASGLRLIGYQALLPNSDFAVGRIFDVTDAAVKA